MLDTIRNFFRKYTNAFGTLSALLTALTAWLAKEGCLSTGDFAATCNIPWLPVSWMPYATGLFIGLTLIGKFTRPGGWLRSLFGGTAVVVSTDSPKSVAGTVTPAQVAQP